MFLSTWSCLPLTTAWFSCLIRTQSSINDFFLEKPLRPVLLSHEIYLRCAYIYEIVPLARKPPPKPAKPHTNYPQINQTTHKPTKSKLAYFFPWKHLLWLGINSGLKNLTICCPTKYDLFTHPAREKKWVHFFDILARFHILFSSLHSSLRC